MRVKVDDGYSGTNFDRPGIKQILDDAKSGKINLILVKDTALTELMTVSKRLY